MIEKKSFAYKIITEDTIAIVVRKDCEKFLDIILIICKIDLLRALLLKNNQTPTI